MNQRISIKPGELFRIGEKLYARCSDCGDIVCVNKPLIGSMHICSSNENFEKKEKCPTRSKSEKAPGLTR